MELTKTVMRRKKMCKYSNLLLVAILFWGLVLSGCGNDDRGFSSSTGTNSGGENVPIIPGMIYAWPDGSTAPWYMPDPPKTGISPMVGKYTLTSVDSNDYIIYFSVVEELGIKYVRFASDGYRYDKIEIVNGSFFHTWGLGPNWPTDAYGISGCFTSTSKAEGLYKYAGGSQTVEKRIVFISQFNSDQ